MLAGLLLAFLLIFTGGYETVMLNPEMKKCVKTTVQDKESKKQINQILKEIEQDQKMFQKKTFKPTLKNIELLNMDYHSKPENYQSTLSSFYTSTEELQKKYLDAELKIRSITSVAEWNQIMEMVIQKPDKEKNHVEINKMGNKIQANLLNALEKNISDTQNLEKARILLDEYKLKTNNLAEKLLDMGYKQHETIRQYDSPRTNFELLQKDILASRKDYMSFVINMLFQLKEITPEANWKEVAKAINQNLSKASS